MVFEEVGERVVADGIGHPDRNGSVGVVLYDEKGAVGMHVGSEFLNKGGFVFYIMQGVGHEDAVEWRQVERGLDKVGLDGDDRCWLVRAAGGVNSLLPDSRMGVDAVDSAACWE